MNIIRSLVIFSIGLLLATAAQAQEKPNILVIWGDDIGVHNISAYNNGVMGYQTPNIDRIANEGACSPTTMHNRAVRPVERHSLPASIRSAPAF